MWKPGSDPLDRPQLPGFHRDGSHGWYSQTQEPHPCSHSLLMEARLMTSVRTWASSEPSWAGLWRPWAVIWRTAGGDCTRPAAAWLVFLTPGSRAVTRCLLSEVIGPLSGFRFAEGLHKSHLSGARVTVQGSGLTAAISQPVLGGWTAACSPALWPGRAAGGLGPLPFLSSDTALWRQMEGTLCSVPQAHYRVQLGGQGLPLRPLVLLHTAGTLILLR